MPGRCASASRRDISGIGKQCEDDTLLFILCNSSDFFVVRPTGGRRNWNCGTGKCGIIIMILFVLQLQQYNAGLYTQRSCTSYKCTRIYTMSPLHYGRRIKSRPASLTCNTMCYKHTLTRLKIAPGVRHLGLVQIISVSCRAAVWPNVFVWDKLDPTACVYLSCCSINKLLLLLLLSFKFRNAKHKSAGRVTIVMTKQCQNDNPSRSNVSRSRVATV